MGGSHDAVVDHREILAEGVRLVVDNMTRIDAAGRKAELSGGRTGYDSLIHAVGSGPVRPASSSDELKARPWHGRVVHLGRAYSCRMDRARDGHRVTAWRACAALRSSG